MFGYTTKEFHRRGRLDLSYAFRRITVHIYRLDLGRGEGDEGYRLVLSAYMVLRISGQSAHLSLRLQKLYATVLFFVDLVVPPRAHP